MFFFSSRRRHTRWPRDWSSDVCSSDLAIVGDGVLFLENDGHARSARHELRQLAEERTIFVHRVKALGLGFRQADEFHRADGEAVLLNPANDLADEVLTYGIGFDDCQRAFYRHRVLSSGLWIESVVYAQALKASNRGRRSGCKKGCRFRLSKTRETLYILGGAQRADDIVEVALHHRVERIVLFIAFKAVVGDAVLGIVVRAYFCGAISRTNHRLTRLAAFGVALLHLELVQP